MGAWGIGIFENDAALDFVCELNEADDLKRLFKDLFDRVIEEEYFIQDEGCNVLVAAALINSIKNKDKYLDLFESESELMKKVEAYKFTDLVDECLEALKAVLSEKSELKELWEDTDYFDEWKAAVLELYEDIENSYKK